VIASIQLNFNELCHDFHSVVAGGVDDQRQVFEGLNDLVDVKVIDLDVILDRSLRLSLRFKLLGSEFRPD
jgi:hypothetical protein